METFHYIALPVKHVLIHYTEHISNVTRPICLFRCTLPSPMLIVAIQRFDVNFLHNYHISGYYPTSSSLFKTRLIVDCILSPSSGGTYSVELNLQS
jgi:hypothetical protein